MKNDTILRLILSQKGVKLNLENKSGYASLTWAIKCGSEAAVKLLLEQDDSIINPSQLTNHTQVPLHTSLWAKDSAMLRLLIQHEDINPNLRDSSGFTTLARAIESKHRAAVMLLLKNKDTDASIDATDSGSTHLGIAATQSDDRIFQMVLERQDTDVNAPNYGYPPLCLAAKANKASHVKLLLEHPNIEINKTSSSRDAPRATALWHAMERGHTQVARLLLTQEDIDATAHPKNDMALLQLATKNRDIDILHELLPQNTTNLNLTTCSEGNPLAQAVDLGQFHIVRLLLEQPDIDPNARFENFQSDSIMRLITNKKTGNYHLYDPCQGMETYGSVAHVWISAWSLASNTQCLEALLQHNKIDPNLKDDRFKRTPLYVAVLYEEQERVQLLLAHPRTNPNLRDIYGWTALHGAVYCRNSRIVGFLLAHAQIDPNRADEEGRTPLLIAVDRENETIARQLLKHPKTRPDFNPRFGKTASMLAQEKGYTGMIRAFEERAILDRKDKAFPSKKGGDSKC
ncbi:ankyrin repeat-containing domain protein [Xylariaceae sp. FL0255]|nr:ankyrin repeat-containing domain protein [Xylariaceae sp. FL0255]